MFRGNNKLNWFLVSIKNTEVYSDEFSILENIHREYNGKNVKEIKGRKGKVNFAYATNRVNEIQEIQFNAVVVIGDIRIHNRDEIMNRYNLDVSYYSKKDNAALISEIYTQRGIESIKDLVGEFAFVIFDEKSNKAYAVRDHLGVKTLFWIQLENEFVFSSDIFLMKDFFNIKDINYSYFKEFHEKNGIVDTPITPFNNVNRLPSGQHMVVENKKVELTKYWDLSDVKSTISYSSEEEYFEHFRQLLSQSVRSRIVLGDNNSIMLSGGLDSTSIYALAKSGEKIENIYSISSVSAVFNELKECDETEYIEELLTKYKDTGEYENFDKRLMFDDFPNKIPIGCEPNVNSLYYEFAYNLIEKSVAKGQYNILTGFAGDHLLSGTLYITKDYCNRFQFKKAFSFLTEYSMYTNASAFKNMINYMIKPDIAKEFIGNNESDYYESIKRKFKKIKTYNQKELYFQITNAKSHLYTDRTIGGLTGADIYHPFLDRRLVEFVYQIPGELRIKPDYSKYILRESMREYLTPAIVDRLNKTAHLAYTYKSLKKNWSNIIKAIENPSIVSELKLTTAEEWKISLGKWRNGIDTPSDFLTLLSIELWYRKFNQK